jgi:hypothetical protein
LPLFFSERGNSVARMVLFAWVLFAWVLVLIS